MSKMKVTSAKTVKAQVAAFRGPVGATGPVGPEGPAGKDGKDGVSIVSVEQTRVGTADGDVNILSVRTSDGKVTPFAVKNGSKGERGEIGPEGPAGEAGPQGLRGEKGERGERGEIGPEGPAGEAGPAGPQGIKGDDGISIVSVLQRVESEEDEGKNVLVVKLSNGDESIFRVKNGSPGLPGTPGEKGEKGDKGDAGPAGPQGPAGAGAHNLLDGSGAGSIYARYADGYTGMYAAAMNTAIASGSNAFAEGQLSEASGSASHAEGKQTKAIGLYAHSEGDKAEARGQSSHAEGQSTVASDYCQHVQGLFNVIDEEGRYAHIVGNGDTGKRANAHTLDWHGNAWFAGRVYVGGTSQDDATELGMPSDKQIEDAVKDYLDENPPTGGGLPTGEAPYQQLVTDADGNAVWEDKPFGEQIGVILPETEINGEGENMVTLSMPIVVGESYTVVINGTAYECVAAPFTMDGVSAEALGDVNFLLTGEPTPDAPAFVLLQISGMTDAMMLDGSTSTVSISGKSFKKLDPKYIDLAWMAEDKAVGETIVPLTVHHDDRNYERFSRDVASVLVAEKDLVVLHNDRLYETTLINAGEYIIGGNASIVSDNFPDTGEPFYFMITSDLAELVFKTSDACLYAIYAVGDVQKIPVKLPEKYAPNGNAVLYVETTQSGSANNIYPINKTYEEILMAYVRGYQVIFRHAGKLYYLSIGIGKNGNAVFTAFDGDTMTVSPDSVATYTKNAITNASEVEW